MGCFLACFGFSHKRKKRKPSHKRHGSYEPLDSAITIVRLGSEENPTTSSDSGSRHKPKEKPSSKTRKKVSFNLNVQIYEPISTAYHFLENEEENDKKMERKCEETEEQCLSTSIFESDSTASKMGSSNLNYRYQNCRDFYDEEDDIAFEDSDLDDDEIGDEDEDFEYDGDSDINSQRVSQGESMSSDKTVSCDEPAGDKASNISMERTDKKDYILSVLKPVENITQWREAKVKAAPFKHQRKENVSLFQESLLPFMSKPSSKPSSFSSAKPRSNQSQPLLQEIPVDSSLSSWLNSTST